MTYTYLIPEIPTNKDHIQVGANNLVIKLQIKEGNSPLVITGATVKNIILQKPDNTLVSGSAEFYSDGADGIIYYRTGATDLDQPGEYEAQAYIEMAGFAGYTTPVQFRVYSNLPLTNAEEDELFP